MKAIPTITVILISQTMFLNYVLSGLRLVHFTASRNVPTVDRQLLNTSDYWLRLAGFSWLGFSLLSLGLILLSWKTRLCSGWAIVGLILFWVLMFFGPGIANVMKYGFSNT